MANVTVWWRNGDKLEVQATDKSEIRELENLPFKEESGVTRVKTELTQAEIDAENGQ